MKIWKWCPLASLCIWRQAVLIIFRHRALEKWIFIYENGAKLRNIKISIYFAFWIFGEVTSMLLFQLHNCVCVMENITQNLQNCTNWQIVLGLLEYWNNYKINIYLSMWFLVPVREGSLCQLKRLISSLLGLCLSSK